MKGIEPSYAAWEAAVLPLNYTRIKIPINQVSGNQTITSSMLNVNVVTPCCLKSFRTGQGWEGVSGDVAKNRLCSARLLKLLPGSALFCTYFTPASTFPLCRVNPGLQGSITVP